MIKSLEEMVINLYMADKLEYIEKELKEYAFSIVQACQDNFECELETYYDPEKEEPYNVPVLVRASIEAVKKQIK